MGLLGNEDSPHMNPYHLEALLLLAKKNNIKNVFIHFFTDGRDSYPEERACSSKGLEKKNQRIGAGKIASLVGRFYAMDRAKNWNRLKIAYDLLVSGKGKKFKNSEDAVEITMKIISPMNI